MAQSQSYNKRTKKWVLRESGKIISNQDDKFEGIPVTGQGKETSKKPAEKKEKPAEKVEETPSQDKDENPYWLW